MAEDILKEIDENEKKIEWTLDQLKPGTSDEIRSQEAINLLDELENEKLELEKKESEKDRYTTPERVALFYIRIFGSLFFVVLFIIFIAGWIGIYYYLTSTGQYTFIDLTILNTVMVALAVLQMPFIMISLRMIQKKENESEDLGYERERLAIKLQTLNAEDLKSLDTEHTALRDEHESLRRSIGKMQDSLDRLNKNLSKMMHEHLEETKEAEDQDEPVFNDENDEEKDTGIHGRARIIDFQETIDNLRKRRSSGYGPENKGKEEFEINEDFMNNFKKEINELKRKESSSKKNSKKDGKRQKKPKGSKAKKTKDQDNNKQDQKQDKNQDKPQTVKEKKKKSDKKTSKK